MFDASASIGRLSRRGRRRTSPVVEPEVLVERRLEVGRLGAGTLAVSSPPRRRSGPGPGRRRRRSPAPRTARSAPRASSPSAKRMPSHESFHPGSPGPGRSPAGTRRSRRRRGRRSSLDPLEGPVGVRAAAGRPPRAPAPPAQLAEQHDEQRRGVGGAVVDAPAAERQRRRLAEAHLVQDAARLLLGAGVDVLALEAGERLQHAEGEVGVDDERHPRRDAASRGRTAS
jgi:hypothetical protein